jgi:hypothetical protein
MIWYMADTEEERNHRSLARRHEVLTFPMVPMRLHGYVSPSSTDPRWNREPEAVGIAPSGEALALWRDRLDDEVGLATRHSGGKAIDASIELRGLPSAMHFIQSLPKGRVLVSSVRSSASPSAFVWSADGLIESQGDLGDAIKHILTTEEGEVWVGYFDEAIGNPGPSGHGLARFSDRLEVAWLYPTSPQTPLPSIFDCYSLNVIGEAAYFCAYSDFRLVEVCDDQATDLGQVPYRGARALLIDGDSGAMIFGYGPDYDVVTPLHIRDDGIEVAGPSRRIVMPDGLEIRSARQFCRGPDLHVFVSSGWYRLGLDDLLVV